MHQRTWLSILSFPLVAAYTYPVLFQPTRVAAKAQAPAQVQAPAQDPLAGLSDIQDVLTLVRDNYVDNPDLEKVIAGGVQGVLERAHPLNAYLTPEDLHLPDPGPAGVGITVVKRQIYAQVVAVVPDSPAAKAGFQPSDMVRKLDGESIGPMSAWTLERRLRGPVGSDLTLLRYAAGSGDLKTVTLKRQRIQAPAIAVRRDPRATVLTLADLDPGRAAELRGLLAGLDHKLPLVLDLRPCAGGTLAEAAQVAGLFVGAGPLATVQEAGKPGTPVAVAPAGLPAFAQLAVLQGSYTLGPAEALSSALKFQHVPIFGERTYGLGVERSRYLLKQGGAVELVTRRWMGAGGEYLGAGGEKPESLKPQEGKGVGPRNATLGYGVVPDHVIKALRPDERVGKGEDDPLPKILEVLSGPSKAKPASAA
jgi:carboxyl-terminal processing protease